MRYDKSDYSVPARWVGTRVSVDAGDNVIVIRAKDLIEAEHLVASGPGQPVESPAHVRERWQRFVPTLVAPPPKRCHITFTEAVQVRRHTATSLTDLNGTGVGVRTYGLEKNYYFASSATLL